MEKLAEIIAGTVEKQGPIPFSRFMEMALYCPVYGYYEAEEDKIGRRGDYYTSVSVGRLFGELLARQFAEWVVSRSEGPSAVELVEAGAHNGQLARDILEWMECSRPELCENLRYVILEPSRRRQRWQQQTLERFVDRVRWVQTMGEITREGGASAEVWRLIFSNELLDAMPVHRLGWDAQQGAWFEWGVTTKEKVFEWVRLPIESQPEASEALGRVLKLAAAVNETNRRDLELLLPHGYTIEVCPAAEKWWAEAAAGIQFGKLMTIDYGLSAAELFTPERTGGTLRAYRRHRVIADLLAAPGQQDLTSHVNFGLLAQTGERLGLKTEQLTSQGRFVTSLATPHISELDWTPERIRQFQTLTHPEHLGSKFRVLIQSR
jgi:SAM-dependent MidA family methyltransferase